MLPVVEPDGVSTFRQVVLFSIVLIPVSLLPYWMGMAGIWYGIGITILGLIMLGVGINLRRTHSAHDAKMLLRTSIIYLPLFFILILSDTSFR